MVGFKVTTTVFLAILIVTFATVAIAKRRETDTVIVSALITAVQIMAIVAIWM